MDGAQPSMLLCRQVHNPVAPTGELLRALGEIGGPVAHIVVPNGSPEHWWAPSALIPSALEMHSGSWFVSSSIGKAIEQCKRYWTTIHT